jgi:hypothetical protein
MTMVEYSIRILYGKFFETECSILVALEEHRNGIEGHPTAIPRDQKAGPERGIFGDIQAGHEIPRRHPKENWPEIDGDEAMYRGLTKSPFCAILPLFSSQFRA